MGKEKRVKNIIAAIALLLPSIGFGATQTPSLLLYKPQVGDTDYVERLNQSIDILDAAVLDKRTGGTIQGDLTVSGSIIGDATFLSGLPATVQFHKEDLTSLCDGIEDTFVLSTAPVAASVHVVMDGLVQRPSIDFTLSGDILVMSTAPASDTSSFLVFYATAAQGAPGGGGGVLNVDPPILGIGSIGDHLRLDTSSVTMLGSTIEPSEAPLLATQVQVAQLVVSTGNLQSQIDGLPNVGVANAPILGNGSVAAPFRLDSSSVSLLGPTIEAPEVTFNYAGSASQAGPANTALALNANPTDCAAGSFANAIDSAGNLSCSNDGSGLSGIVVSSFTQIPQTAFTNTTFDVAVATVTLTTRGGLVYAVFAGVFVNSGANNYMSASLLVDGAPPISFSGQKLGIASCAVAQAGDFCSLNFFYPLLNIPSGTHSIALMVKTEGGTATLNNNSSWFARFGAHEIR